MQEELSLSELFYVLKRRWKRIVLCMILGGVAAFLVSSFLLPKKYTSSVELYINNTSASDSKGNLNLNDINAAQKLVSTYIVILENSDVLLNTAKTIGGDITEKFLEENVSMSSVENTEVLRISAETEDPELSAEICNTLADLAPDVLTRVVKAGSVEQVAEAVAPEIPSSPNIKRNTALGAVLFLFVAGAITLALYFLDTTVKGEDDVKQRTGLPVLGEIPYIGNSKN